MLKTLNEIVEKVRSRGAGTVAVAVAEDVEVLHAVHEAESLGLARAILVGDAEKIRTLGGDLELLGGMRIIDEPSSAAAALAAVQLVRDGEASVLMKGALNTSDFLRAVLDPACGLRSGRLLSHLAAFEMPGEPRLVFHSDGGMNVAPTLEEKKMILRNSLDALHCMGISEPKVALLAANEQVSPNVMATVDAKAIADAWKNGEFNNCVIEGPIALDVATSREAARHKGIDSRIAGETDLFIMPSIEAGNIAGKALLRYAHARMAGVVLGALCPIVLVSRADNATAKLNSIALACLSGYRQYRQVW